MKFPLRFVLILTAVIAAAFLVLAVACGDDEEEEAPGTTPTVAADETPGGTPTGEVSDLPSIPTYPGAEEIETATWTGTGPFPIKRGAFIYPIVGGEVPDPEEYGTVQFTFYETSDSPDKVLDFYNEEFEGWELWEPEGTFSMEELGQKGEVAVWSKDDGNVAAWLAAFEEEGTTSVVIAMGARQ